MYNTNLKIALNDYMHLDFLPEQKCKEIQNYSIPTEKSVHFKS